MMLPANRDCRIQNVRIGITTVTGHWADRLKRLKDTEAGIWLA
jgi:hypothetical protein